MGYRTRVPALLSALFMAGGAVAPGVAAQVCGIGNRVAVVGGYADFRVADGTAGPQLGADVTVDANAVGVQVSARTVQLEGNAPDPVIGRAEVRVPILALQGIVVCGDVLGGISRFSVVDDAATVLAGGLGLTLAPAEPGVVRPWISVRGLAGWATGTILDLTVSESAFAVGVAGGLTARLGQVSIGLAAARDGFDAGLGTPPYPAISAELALGYHF